MHRILIALVLCLLGGTAIAQNDAPLTPKQLQAKLRNATQRQDWAAVESAARALIEQSPEDGDAWFGLGYALHATQRYAEALPAHEKAASIAGGGNRAAVAAYNAACAHALLGETDAAFQWLETARDKGFAQPQQVQDDTDLESLHGDPRFDAYLKSVAANAKAAPAATGGRQVYAQTTDRKSTRLAAFAEDPALRGQVVITWGPVAWNDSYEAALAGTKLDGKRWRLGSNSWTTLETDVPLDIGSVRVEPGLYDVVLVRNDGVYSLVLLDPAVVRKNRLDAYQAEQTTGGTLVPLELEDLETSTKKLAMRLDSDPNDEAKGMFVLEFGPHRLSAPVQLHY